MNEEVQTVIRVGEMMYRFGKGITLAAIKVYQKVYYGQWEGKANFEKLHKLCGSHISYLEVKTQDSEVLKKMEEQIFGKYKVLYSPLPDLNGADGCVQYAFNSEQSEALRGGLNQFSLKKIRALSEAKERYGVGTEKYQKLKEKIEAEYPEIRSITSEDYVITRLDEQGKKTSEYKALEKSANEEMKKLDFPQPKEPLEDRVVQFAEAKKKVDYDSLIREGKAQRISVAECRTEYVPIAGKEQPFYHARISETESVVLPPSALMDDKSVIIMHDKKYPVVSTQSANIVKKSGKEISSQIAKNSVQKITGKVAQETVKKGAKTAAKAAMKSNPYTGIASAAAENTVGVVKKIAEISTGKKR